MALTILSVFHSLSGFVFGVGVSPEYDIHPFSSRKLSSTECAEKINQKIRIADLLRNYEEPEAESTQIIAEIDEYESDSDEEDKYSHIAGGHLPYINYDISNFLRPVNPSDFTFSDHGYYILEKFLPEIAEKIGVVIRFTYGMTYCYIGSERDISTGPLRRAI